MCQVHWDAEHLMLTLYGRAQPLHGHCSQSSSLSREKDSKLCNPLQDAKQWLRALFKLLWDCDQIQSNCKVRVEPCSTPNKQLLNDCVYQIFSVQSLYALFAKHVS